MLLSTPSSPALPSAPRSGLESPPKLYTPASVGFPFLVSYVPRAILVHCLMSISLGIQVKFCLFSFFGDFWVRE